MIKKSVHILFFLLFWTNIFAQDPIRYTTKEGLPSNNIYDIQEDENGFMWFATNRGLVKFDGENFRIFTIRDGLPNNDTFTLEKDFKNRLWYFSKSKYQGYIVNDSIYQFPVEGNKIASPRFFFKGENDFWFNNSSGLIHLKDGILKDDVILNQNDFNKNFEKNFEKIDAKNIVLIQNPVQREFIFIVENKLLFFDKNFKKISEKTIELPENHRNFKIENHGLLSNNIAFYGMDKGVLFINTKTKKSQFFSFSNLINVKSVKYFRAYSTKNEIQISVPGNLLIFDYNLNFKKLYTFPLELSKLSYKDSKGNIWLADLSKGICLIKNTQISASYFLKNKKVQKINKIDGVFYAGVSDDGFYTKEKNATIFQLLANLMGQFGGIYQIEKDDSNNVKLMSSGSSFTYSKNSVPQKISSIKILDSENPQQGLKNFIAFRDEHYFIMGSRLMKKPKNSQEIKSVTFKESLLVAAIFNNNLFYGSTDGIFKLENDSLVKPLLKNDLLNTSITNFSASKDYLFVGTDGRGVYLYDEKKVIHLKNTDGFSIQKIIQKEKYLWLATNKGVGQITLDTSDLENSKITNSFYEADGLLQDNTNDIYVENDTLYAASDIGLAKLTTNNNIYQQKPSLYFKTKHDTLRFENYKRENISITFGLHEYANQEHTTYEYRLLPIQQKWTSTKTKTINFSNLPPNLYVLEIKATDQHNNVSTKKQYLKIIPFWFETSLAKIGFFIVLIVLFILLYLFTKRRIQRKAALKSEQETHIAGLELQALRSQMNPHFVHNSLNAIQYYIQRNEVELSENYLSKFSLLIRKFFEYSRKQSLTLKEEIELLENYLDIEKLRFEEKLSFKILVDENLETDDRIIPSMILQPILENAVNHGLFHKKENGNILVHFKFIDALTYEVIITDDGIGIKKSKEIYKNSSKNYQSNSTEVLKERLQLLVQSKLWKIQYSFQDISEISNETGTKVSITFKQTH